MPNYLENTIGLDTTFQQRWPANDFLQMDAATLPPIGGGTSLGTPPDVFNQPTSQGSGAALPVNVPSKVTVNPIRAGTPGGAPGSGGDGAMGMFVRIVVVILGFIFVAVGLNMFKPGLIPNPRNVLHGGH